MSKLTDVDKQALLELARSVIASNLDQSPVSRPADITPPMEEKRGCFVTLHKKGALRGCIGTIEPVRSLLANVEENAANSAFGDPRFPNLASDELGDVDIEISVLTKPEPLEFGDPDDLLEKLKPGVHGVILSRGYQRATFLPQVWDQLPNKIDFLEHLCRKGMMGADCWKKKDTEIKIYTVEYFSE